MKNVGCELLIELRNNYGVKIYYEVKGNGLPVVRHSHVISCQIGSMIMNIAPASKQINLKEIDSGWFLVAQRPRSFAQSAQSGKLSLCILCVHRATKLLPLSTTQQFQSSSAILRREQAAIQNPLNSLVRYGKITGFHLAD